MDLIDNEKIKNSNLQKLLPCQQLKEFLSTNLPYNCNQTLIFILFTTKCKRIVANLIVFDIDITINDIITKIEILNHL